MMGIGDENNGFNCRHQLPLYALTVSVALP
jgi:hypothetical protein